MFAVLQAWFEDSESVLVMLKFFFLCQVCPWKSKCTAQHWQTRRGSRSWGRIPCPDFSSSSWPSWDQWLAPTPQAGPAPPRPSWAGTAGQRAPARTASSAAAPRRNPQPPHLITVPGPQEKKRRRMEEFFSMSTGLVFPLKASPGRGCGPMWLPCTPRDRIWWIGYATLHTSPR